MLPDRVSNPGPLTYESGALPIALRGPATAFVKASVLFSYSAVKIYDTLASNMDVTRERISFTSDP